MILPATKYADLSRLDRVWADRWSEFDDREIWEWVREEIEDLPSCYAVRGRFDADVVPFTKDIFRALRSPTVRQVISKAGIQSLKTLIGEFWLLWLVDNSPGPTQWLQTTNEDAKEHAETRFNLLIEACPRIRKYFTGNSEDQKTVSINFVHMFMLMQGANTKRNLQRKSIKNQMCSEVWQAKYWPPGRIDEASSRMTQFEQTCKQYIESQPGEEDDDLDKRYKLSSQDVWHVRCQGHCRKHQIIGWGDKREDKSRYGIVWETSERTRRRRSNGDWGEWIWPAVIPTIRFVCKYCGDSMADEPRVRRLLNDEGEYISQNPNAPAHIKGFSWNQLTVASLSWASQFMKFQAAMVDMAQGFSGKLIEFEQKVLARNATHDLGHQEITPAIEIYTPSTKGPEKDWYRFMTIDCQADLSFFYWVIRDWNRSGTEARRVARGTANSFDALRVIQLKHGVSDHRTFPDCAYESRRVWAQCIRFGHWGHVIVDGQKEKVFLSWIGLWGRDIHSFVHVEKDERNQEIQTSRLYSPVRHGDPALGKGAAARKAPFFNWSNEQVKDTLQQYRDGKCEGMKWVNPPTPDIEKEDEAEYIRQINSENKRWRWSKEKRRHVFQWGLRSETAQNHYWDCECMQVTAAAIVGILTPVVPVNVPDSQTGPADA